MSSERVRSVRPGHTTWLIVAGGIVALAVAMGIGRFAFTPLMPLMIRDGTLSAASGAEWAAANYAGYLAGALTASWFSSNPRRGLLLSLLGVALTTLAAAWADGESMALAGALLRAAAGVFSAWALICASSWCLAELVRRHAPHLGAWIYTGVGLGIALTGVLAWLGGRQPASWLWMELGVITIVGTVFVWLGLLDQGTSPAAAGARASRAVRPGGKSRHLLFVLCYGTSGFGYIIPATFLPAMAQQLVPDPLVFGLTWPLFGLAAALLRRGRGALVARLATPARLGIGPRRHGARHCCAAGGADSVGLGRLGRAGRRNLHCGHHGGSATGPRTGSCQPNAVAGPDDSRVRCRADRGSAARQSAR